jgi:hypothetical protein
MITKNSLQLSNNLWLLLGDLVAPRWRIKNRAADTDKALRHLRSLDAHAAVVRASGALRRTVGVECDVVVVEDWNGDFLTCSLHVPQVPRISQASDPKPARKKLPENASKRTRGGQEAGAISAASTSLKRGVPGESDDDDK